MKIAVVVKVEELVVDDVLVVFEDPLIEGVQVESIFSTGHRRVQVTTTAGVLWFDEGQLVVCSRDAT